jgi:hypothetical protein
MATFTWDQIAGQLTDGYWNFGGGTRHAFDVTVDRNITVDLSRLSVEARTIAFNALSVWSSATGITFQDVGVAPTAYTETVDIAGSTATTFNISTNAAVIGNINTSGDVDYYRVTLTAGQTYLIGMSNFSTGSSVDSVLELRDNLGNILVSSDDPNDAAVGEYISYTATTTGTYYIAASAFGPNQGAYELSVQTTADITFNDMDPTGAYAYSDIIGNTITRSYVNIADNWSTLSMNSYMLQTYIHEIGHALGLGHAGNYNGNAVYPTNALYDNDSWLASVMSYFSQTDNTFVPGDFAFLATIMPADIIAIQNLYGAGPAGYQTGNTVWGPGGNLGNTLQTMLNMSAGLVPTDPLYYQNQPIAFTVYDTSGTDTLDFSAYSNNAEILLTELQYSDIAGLTDNVVIARGTVIENAIGGAGGESIVGNDVANRLEGRGGNDTLHGGANNDTLNGGTGSDFIFGDAGQDTIIFGNGLLGDFDNINGGADRDLLDMSSTSNGAIWIDFGYNVISGPNTAAGVNLFTAAGEGRVVQMDSMIGTGFNDTMRGDAGSNFIDGGAGDDQLLSYSPYDTVTPYSSLGDVMLGGIGNDLLFSGTGNDYLDGGVGNDTIEVGGGTDTVVTGTGNDVVFFSPNCGTDTVTDFTGGAGVVDVLRLYGFGTAFDTAAEVITASSQHGADTWITLPGTTIILQNFTATNLVNDDFVLV